MPKLENWALCFNSFDFYTSIERQNISLQGNVYGNPKFEEGKFVITSKVMDLDIPNRKAITYSGTRYTLGTPDQEWISWLKENKYMKYISEIEKLLN